MPTSNLHMLAGTGPWFVAMLITFFLGIEAQKIIARRNRKKWADNKAVRKPWKSGPNDKARRSEKTDKPFDAAQQLREVETATFARRSLLNASESRLLQVIDRTVAEVAPNWRVMAQVSMGEILSSPSEAAYRAINSKRVDLLIVGTDGEPLHAVEYQGSGHHLGPAATRDAVKKEALRKAGIGYIEITTGDTPADVRRIIARLAISQGIVPKPKTLEKS